MIPILYEKNEKQFISNGLGRLRDAVRVEVTEERNGIYEVELDYPVNGSHFEDIICGRIIAVRHDDTDDIQPFDIYYQSKPINGLVTFRAQHISYRMAKMTVRGGAGATGIRPAFAILSNSVPTNPFTFKTDIKNTTSYFSATATVPITVRSAIGGVEGSILDTFGGELEWDKWYVRLWKRRGTDKALTIRYGVNMVDYNDETDFSETYSHIVPYWSGNVNGKDIVRRGHVASSGKTMYDGRSACVPVDLSDKFENAPTTAQIDAEAQRYLKTQDPTLPSRTISVDFVRIADTSLYEQFAPLQKCGLCDTVQVEFPMYKMSGQFKIVKTVFDVLQERFTSMELGDLSTTLSEALGISESSPNTANLELQNILLGEETNAITVNVSAGAYKDVTQVYTKDGFYPIGIVGWSLTGSGATVSYLTRCYLSSKSNGSATLTARIHTDHTQTASVSLVVSILWAQIID